MHVCQRNPTAWGGSAMWGGGGGSSMLKACARLATRWAEGCRSVGRCPEDACPACSSGSKEQLCSCQVHSMGGSADMWGGGAHLGAWPLLCNQHNLVLPERNYLKVQHSLQTANCVASSNINEGSSAAARRCPLPQHFVSGALAMRQPAAVDSRVH